MGDIIFTAKNKITENSKAATWVADGDNLLLRALQGFVKQKGDNGEELLIGKVPEKENKEKECFCTKKFTPEDIKGFYGKKTLFRAKNCPIPENKKSIEVFTEEINKTLEQYEINTCIRKAHFMAQIEAETNFNTTLEYADGWDYDHSTHEESYSLYKLYLKDKKKNIQFKTPKNKRGYDRYIECLDHGHHVKGYGPKYKGRGLIQITWKDTYEAYFSKLNNTTLIETPEIVASDIKYVCDSAGWYWKYRSNWGNLNNFADKDDLISVAVGVNGGLNGFAHRKSNLKKILMLMDIKNSCVNLKVPNIGTYKFETSDIRNSRWGRKNKIKIQAYDDK